MPQIETAKSGTRLTLTPTQGAVGTHAVLKGEGFAPGAPLRLVWETAVGSRVTDAGFAPQQNEMENVTPGADGRIEWTLTIPDDLGGLHVVALRRGGDVVARAHFAIETSLVGVSPRSGPAGTPVTIHLKGVGWTEYDNIYVATYDNAYMGYACGFNTGGDVVIHFTAAGAPGVHLIDLYPGIYQGPEGGQQLYRLPQLTYAHDLHPAGSHHRRAAAIRHARRRHCRARQPQTGRAHGDQGARLLRDRHDAGALHRMGGDQHQPRGSRHHAAATAAGRAGCCAGR